MHRFPSPRKDSRASNNRANTTLRFEYDRGLSILVIRVVLGVYGSYDIRGRKRRAIWKDGSCSQALEKSIEKKLGSARTLRGRHSAPPGRCPCLLAFLLDEGDTHQRLHPLQSVRFQLLSPCLQLFHCGSRHHPTRREDQGDEAPIGEGPGLDSSPLYLLQVFCGLLDDVER